MYKLLLLAAFAGVSLAQEGVPVSVVITHEGKNVERGQLKGNDLTVKVGKQTLPVTNLKVAGENTTLLQLLILIDDSARGSFGTQVQDLKRFVTGLPENVEIGVGYMRNGITAMEAPLTRDHQAAAQKIRLALGAGGADVSPYDSISDAIHNWPQGNTERREIIMISSGIEGLGGGFTPDNPYVNKGIEDAQKAGVVVFPIYNPSAGVSGRQFWRSTWGQNFLSQLADETGGEAYNIDMGNPVSVLPFLQQIMDQISRQYILTFSAKPETKSELRPLKVELAQKEKGDNIAHPSKVYVKAGM